MSSEQAAPPREDAAAKKAKVTLMLPAEKRRLRNTPTSSIGWSMRCSHRTKPRRNAAAAPNATNDATDSQPCTGPSITAHTSVPTPAMESTTPIGSKRWSVVSRDVGTSHAMSTIATNTTGTVTLAVSPWGEVEVNGKPAGTTPPLTRLSLPTGTHTITLRNADFPPHTVQVQVGADKPVALRHRFGS